MTNADRLNSLLVKAFPSLKEKVASGEWGETKAPYEFSTLSDGRQRLTITDPESGDRMGVVGTSRTELLDKLEARLQ